jgi:HEAT repeat protein
MRLLRLKRKLFWVLIFVMAVGSGAWWQRGTILAWVYFQGLAQAGDNDRQAWIERVASLDGEAIPGLCRCLEKPEPAVCANAKAALVRLAADWPSADSRQESLHTRLAAAFPRLSMAGQCTVLSLYATWAGRAMSTTMAEAAVRLLGQGGRAPDKDVRGQALALTAALVNQDLSAEQTALCRELVRTALRDSEAVNRTEAARLAVHPRFGLARDVAPLLDDPAPEVRQMAMAAVGSAPDAVATDDLLRSLHDSDADVRRLCEAALRGRGLRPADVAMGRLVTDASPTIRLKILNRLPRTGLEPGVWLRRLSQDPNPAVRAGAIRAAADYAQVDFRERLEVMSQHDPSATVRQLAEHYLNWQRNNPSEPQNR